MGLLLDSWGLALAEATLAASAWLAIVLVASCRSRQPARRRLIARVGVVGLVTLLPTFVIFQGRPRLLVAGEAGTAPELGYLWAMHAVVALGGLAWVGVGTAVGRWLVERSAEPGPAAEEIYRGLARGRKVCPTLRVSDRVRRPVLVGLFRPVILIPVEWDERAAPQRMRLGFLHELSHAQNRDLAFQFLGRLAMACWVFLPGLSWLVRRMRQDHEILADLHAARCYGDWTQYATTLVDLAASHHRRVAPGPAEIGQAVSPLTERLSALLIDPRGVEELPPVAWRTSISALGMSCLVVLATIQIGLPRRGGESAPEIRAPLREVFRLSRILLEPGPDRPAELLVPFRLPDRYEVDCEVWCHRAAGANIAGARLVESPDEPGWHSFTLRREPCGIAARWDGRPVAVDRGKPVGEAWLIFSCPAGGEMRVKEVEVRY